MAQRTEVKYLASFHDSSYGIDDEGEVFRTIADIKAALEARHRHGAWDKVSVFHVDGREERVHFPAVSNEAYLLVWRLDELDQSDAAGLILAADEGRKIDSHRYMAREVDLVVWVGERQGIRAGSFDQFIEQRDRRGREAAHAAGSVVV